MGSLPVGIRYICQWYLWGGAAVSTEVKTRPRVESTYLVPGTSTGTRNLAVLEAWEARVPVERVAPG